MTAAVAGFSDAFVTRLAQRAPKGEELRVLPAAGVVELNESGLPALLKPAVLANCAGAVWVGVGQRGSRGSARRCWVSRTASALCLAGDGAAGVAVLVTGPEIGGAL